MITAKWNHFKASKRTNLARELQIMLQGFLPKPSLQRCGAAETSIFTESGAKKPLEGLNPLEGFFFSLPPRGGGGARQYTGQVAV
jgi:hypothetical protein